MGSKTETSASLALPSEAANQIAELAASVKQLDLEIESFEQSVATLKALRQQKCNRDLPELLTSLGFQKVETDAFVVSVGDKYYGGWPKDEAKSAQAKAHLAQFAADGALRQTVTIFAPPNDEEAQKHLKELLSRLHNSPLIVKVEETVHPQTLYKLARDLIDEGQPVDLNLLGIHVDFVATVKEKKK